MGGRGPASAGVGGAIAGLSLGVLGAQKSPRAAFGGALALGATALFAEVFGTSLSQKSERDVGKLHPNFDGHGHGHGSH